MTEYASHISAYGMVALFTIIGVAFIVVTMWLSWIFRPFRPTRDKLSPYECGAPVTGDAWVQFRIGFYIWGLIFVIFDVDAVFVYPWAKVLRFLNEWAKAGEVNGIPFNSNAHGVFAFGEMFVFFLILLFGLLYAWRKGVLKWEGV